MCENTTTPINALINSTMSPTILGTYYFNLVTVMLFSVFGLIGNLMVIFILTKPKFLEVPLFRYLIVATIANNKFIIHLGKWISQFIWHK